MSRFAATILVCAAFAACGKTAVPPPATTSAEQALADRRACKFKKGALTRDTVASGARLGSQIPINNIVIIMQENRSFDSYFSQLSHGGVDVAPTDATNPDADGKPISRFHQTKLCFDDTAHSWGNAHLEYDKGKLDGFVTANNPGGERAMGYFTDAELPFYYDLARTFAISDRHFCSVMTSTWTNRMYLFAATSWGLISNDFPPDEDKFGERYENVFLELSDAKVDWRIYTVRHATPAILATTLADNEERFQHLEDYFKDAKAGTLPAVSIVEPDTTIEGLSADEHPPADPQPGQAFSESVAKALFASPQWAHSALIITYDENGGLYDHVPPPAACPPDDLVPHPMPEGVANPYDTYGFRVPLIVVSPYARRGYVSHNISDHTSITRLIEARFDLPAMTARDANADPLFDLFDFDHPNLEIPALRPALVDPGEHDRCLAAYPSHTE